MGECDFALLQGVLPQVVGALFVFGGVRGQNVVLARANGTLCLVAPVVAWWAVFYSEVMLAAQEILQEP